MGWIHVSQDAHLFYTLVTYASNKNGTQTHPPCIVMRHWLQLRTSCIRRTSRMEFICYGREIINYIISNFDFIFTWLNPNTTHFSIMLVAMRSGRNMDLNLRPFRCISSASIPSSLVSSVGRAFFWQSQGPSFKPRSEEMNFSFLDHHAGKKLIIIINLHGQI